MDEKAISSNMRASLPRSQLSSPFSEDDEDYFPPKGQRLAPVGAASTEDEDSMATSCPAKAKGRETDDSSTENGGSGGGLLMGDGRNGDGGHLALEEKLRQMEEDQEELNTSLMSLTSHFAKVLHTYLT